jgi:hypothetical protein
MKPTITTRTADNAIRGEEQMTATSDRSNCWMMQGINDGGDNSSRDVVALAVTRVGRWRGRIRWWWQTSTDNNQLKAETIMADAMVAATHHVCPLQLH